jgi:hypothetical protein
MKGLCYVVAVMLAMAPMQMGHAGDTDGPSNPVVQQIDEQVATSHALIVVEAPTKGRVGELIRFDLTNSTATQIKWKLVPDVVDFESYDEGQKAVFSARAPGEYMFIIAAAMNGTVDVVTHTVTIQGPPKEPTTPDLSLWVPYWLYPLQLDKAEALALAQGFEATAARITPLSTPKGIIEATAEANREALGGSISAWRPFLTKLQSAMKNRAKQGLLQTPEQHKEMWLEIARGLHKYAD